MEPAVWGVLGTVLAAIITGLALILVESIKSRRATESVKGDIANLMQDVQSLSNRLDDHITWHLEREQYVYVRPTLRRN